MAKESNLDRFAAEVARLLGYELLPQDFDRIGGKQTREIRINDKDTLCLSDSGQRVIATMEAADIPQSPFKYSCEKAHPSARAIIDPNARSIDLIVEDNIRRRVIDASQKALKLQRECAVDPAFIGKHRPLGRKPKDIKSPEAAIREAWRRGRYRIIITYDGGGEAGFVSRAYRDENAASESPVAIGTGKNIKETVADLMADLESRNL